ncbi:MAG: cellulose biosynthesis protein BcsS [Rhizobiales bacterium]|nr:cellulose biosynthesis protein BcsS [Hyphomicrobiales bacterium]
MGKRILTSVAGGLAFALMATPALADGMVSLKDTVVAPEAPSWSGMYFGGSVGYGWNKSTNRYREVGGGGDENHHESGDGGLVSLVWGYDCQWDRIVVGVFGDVDWSDINRGRNFDGMTIDRSYNIGGRIGVLVQPTTLAFLTAGYSRAHFDNDGAWDILDASGPPGTILRGRNSADFDGYFIGGGLEHMLGNGFFLRGEVRYAKYDAETTNSGAATDGTIYVDKEEPDIWTAKLGITYKFNRGNSPLLGGESDGNIKVISYGGIDVAKDIWTLYSGNLFALNGDFTRNGFVFRTFGWYSDYSYDGISLGSDVDAKDRAMDAMLGYLFYHGSTSVIGYLGMEVRDVDLSPDDPANPVRGTETGFKVALEIESGDESPFYYAFDTSYSTAFDTYYGNLRLGWNRSGTKFGPEGEIWSEEGDVTSRLGAFVVLPFNLRPTLPAEVSLSGGYQWVDNDDSNGDGFGGHRGGEGAYFNSYLKVLF